MTTPSELDPAPTPDDSHPPADPGGTAEALTSRRWVARSRTSGLALLAGLCLAASVPPWGWWPLAFVGIAIWDRLLADQPARTRFCRSWIVAAGWLAPAMLWMWALTAPGYVVAVAVYSAYFGIAGVLTPSRAPGRWIALPAAVVLAEISRWTFPFGGVPLATLAQGQASSPLGQSARIGTAIAVSGLVVVGGVALSAALMQRWRAAAVGLAVVVVLAGLGMVAPRGHTVDTFTFALVQGGGPQQTRSYKGEERVVFQRHLDASQLVDTPVDVVLWPENVVAVEGRLEDRRESAELSALAQQLDTTLIVGVTEDIDDQHFTNASIVFLPDGSVGERYDKVRRVPFGEYVPLRGIIERLAGEGSGLSARDAVPGTEPAVIETPVGKFAVVISWEVFFTNRAREGVLDGGETILNPTNGSTYWLRQVQTQQVASSQLRAIESGRWVLQAAPTGFSAVVDESGDVLQRTGVSETRVLQGTAPLRQGDTIATVVGPMPTVFLAIAVLALVWGFAWRSGRASNSPTSVA